MPKVPVNENRVQLRSTNVETMKVGTLSGDIVGNNVFEAQQGMLKTFENAGQGIIDHFVREKDKEVEKKTLELANKAYDELDNVLFDPANDDGGKPKGLLNRKLGQVGEDTVIEYDGKVNEIISRYSKDLDSESAYKLQATLGTHARTLRDNVARHQVTQRDADYQNTVDSNLKIQIGSAAKALNKEALDATIANIGLTVEAAYQKKGADVATTTLAKQKAIEEAIASNIYTKFESNPAEASQTLTDNEKNVSPEFYQKVGQVIKGKLFENKRSGLYEDVFSKPNFKLPNGEPDMGKIERTIRASKTMTEPEIEQMVSYAKARAGGDSQVMHARDKSKLEAMENEIVKMKKEGVSLDEALKKAPQYASGFNRDLSIKDNEDVIRRYYSNPGQKSDPETFLGLYEKVKTGSASDSEIRQAVADGKLNPEDALGFRKGVIDGKLGTDKAEYNLVTKDFDNKLRANLGSDKNAINDAMIVFRKKTKGMNPEEAALEGKKLLEKVEVPGKLWGTNKVENFTIEKQKIDANNEAWGGVYQAVGQKEVDAIGGGFTRSNDGKKWGLGDVNNFAQEFGGIEAIGKGTPVNNAIKSLNAKGKKVTAANVKAVLAIHKDGNY